MDQPVSNSVQPRGSAAPSSGAARGGPRPATACLAAAAHLTIIAAATFMLPARILPPSQDAAIPVIFQPASPQDPPQTLSAETLPASATSLPDTLTPIPPLNIPADPRALLPRTVHHRSPPATIRMARQTEAARQTSPPAAPVQLPAPPPAPSTPSSAQALHAWEASVHQAVQNALIYPNAARLMHYEGRTRVRFDYSHNAVSGVAVAQSSGLSSLDSAAAAAVMRAAIPPPPPELASQTHSLILWVNFSLTAAG
jgi:protein TonB